MASWDNVSLPAAPAAASYAAPLLNFAPIGNLAQDYFQGRQNARTLALQNAFKEGLPTLKDQNGTVITDPQTGQPMLDTNAISQTAAKLGGLDAAMPFLQLQLKGQALGGVASAIGDGGVQAPPSPAPDAQSAAVPAHGVPGGTSPPPGGRNVTLAPNVQTSNEATQPDTLSNIVQAQISDPALAGKVMTAVAARLGIDPGTRIDPNNPTVKAYIRTAQGGVMPTGGTAGQPPGAVAPPAGSGNPPGMDLSTANVLSQKAAQIRSAALRAEAYQPGLGKAGLDQAQALDDRAKQIREIYSRNAELPPEQKLAIASGTQNPLVYEQQKKLAEAGTAKQVEIWGKLADEGQVAKEHLALINRVRSLGIGDISGAWAKMTEEAGNYGVQLDPNLPQIQGIQSVVNQLIPTMRVPNMRVTNFDMSLFRDAIPRMVNTPQGNQLIMNTLQGVAQYKSKVGDLAQQGMDGTLTAAQVRDRIGKISDPFLQFKQSEFGKQGIVKPTAGQQQQYREGQTASGPNGQRLIFQNGKWAPFT